MKNQDRWQPSKYVYRKGKLIASRDGNELNVASRLMGDLIARFYERSLREHARGRLLDLGCGRVPLYATYKDLITENICVDWENTLHKNEYLDFECDLTKDLPFEDEDFDTIVLSDVLEHIPQPEHLWREMARVLAKGGKILMNVPFFYWVHEQPHDFYRYTEFALRRLVEHAGLRVLELEALGGSPEVLADIHAKHCAKIPLIGEGLAIATQAIAGCFSKGAVGKKISARTAKLYPLGYAVVAEKR